VIGLRNVHDELRRGSLCFVDAGYNYLAYGRFHKDGHCLILINNNDGPVEKEIDAWVIGTPKSGRMRMLLQTSEEGYSLGGPEFEMRAGRIRVTLPKTSATILKFDRHAPAPMEEATISVQEKPEILTPEEEMRRKRRFVY